jgi:hypothetical protein
MQNDMFTLQKEVLTEALNGRTITWYVTKINITRAVLISLNFFVLSLFKVSCIESFGIASITFVVTSALLFLITTQYTKDIEKTITWLNANIVAIKSADEYTDGEVSAMKTYLKKRNAPSTIVFVSLLCSGMGFLVGWLVSLICTEPSPTLLITATAAMFSISELIDINQCDAYHARFISILLQKIAR